MASWLNFTTTQNSITASVAGLSTSSTYKEIYIRIGNQRSTNLIRGGSGYSNSLSFTATGLTAGTDYYCEWYLSTGISTYSDYIYISTDAPPRPPIVGDVSYVSVSNYSAGTIGVSWGSASNATTYRIEVSYAYGGYITSTSSTGNYVTISGLPQGTYLQVKVYGSRYDDGWGWNNGGANYGYITTTDYSVGGVGNVYVNQLSTSGALNIQWSYATNATSYRLEVYDYYNGDTLAFSDYGITYNSYTVYGLRENTYYKVKVYGQGSYGNGNPSYGYGWTKSFAPASLTGLSAWAGTASGGIHASWNVATNATGYIWEIYRGTSTSGVYITGSNTTGTSMSYTGLAEYTTYTIKVYGTRSGYSNGGYQTTTVTTKDLTKPSVSITSSDGRGRMYISFSASDSMSGMRTYDTYYTEISNANGSSYSRGAYTTSTYKTFTEDAYGNAFVHDAYYYMRVVAYDAEGNNQSTNVRVQYKVARPSEWTWHTSKVAGGVISLTANEWNSFCTKINQFRQYKSLSNYSFATATSGSIITASIVNQAVNAISAMNPPTSTPSTTVSKSTVITASFFNTLSRSLNSIQ